MSPEQIDTILDAIAQGIGVATFCRENDGYSSCKFYQALSKDAALQERYARAREAQANVYAEEIIEIADDARNDWMEVNGDEDRGWRMNGEHVQRSRLRVDARKWAASKLAPKKYGERQEIEHSGAIDLSGAAASARAKLAGAAGGATEDSED